MCFECFFPCYKIPGVSTHGHVSSLDIVLASLRLFIFYCIDNVRETIKHAFPCFILWSNKAIQAIRAREEFKLYYKFLEEVCCSNDRLFHIKEYH